MIIGVGVIDEVLLLLFFEFLCFFIDLGFVSESNCCRLKFVIWVIK